MSLPESSQGLIIDEGENDTIYRWLPAQSLYQVRGPPAPCHSPNDGKSWIWKNTRRTSRLINRCSHNPATKDWQPQVIWTWPFEYYTFFNIIFCDNCNAKHILEITPSGDSETKGDNSLSPAWVDHKRNFSRSCNITSTANIVTRNRVEKLAVRERVYSVQMDIVDDLPSAGSTDRAHPNLAAESLHPKATSPSCL